MSPSDLSPSGVPVFTCIVYVQRSDAGMQARVANLAGIEATAPSEREALGRVVTTFKQRVGELTSSKQPIPWIDPPLPPEPSEQQRLVPVHL